MLLTSETSGVFWKDCSTRLQLFGNGRKCYHRRDAEAAEVSQRNHQLGKAAPIIEPAFRLKWRRPSNQFPFQRSQNKDCVFSTNKKSSEPVNPKLVFILND